ncbi:uncharacterized protein KY384_007731 [Bacidia gigantensis]|uniref:uncharacterized protein n=1 Tax=Bacidia gigantensis TaxID=2732470 RepID=UPI001D04FA63|nr:uncharacterized protein KY384_007731 [Bacidia gigantensis]KAG8527578.1 hypothetical protein KY384_007731 [Bacidia gigantensis]
MSDANLYSETFKVTETDAADTKYDRVLRLTLLNDSGDTEMKLDVNSELLQCNIGERVQVLLSSTLSLDGSKDDGKGWRDVGRGEPSVADDYDYVCHGKVYRFDEGKGDKLYVKINAKDFVP